MHYNGLKLDDPRAFIKRVFKKPSTDVEQVIFEPEALYVAIDTLEHHGVKYKVLVRHYPDGSTNNVIMCDAAAFNQLVSSGKLAPVSYAIHLGMSGHNNSRAAKSWKTDRKLGHVSGGRQDKITGSAGYLYDTSNRLYFALDFYPYPVGPVQLPKHEVQE